MKKIVINVLLAAVVVLSMASCSDYFDKKPTNKVMSSDFFSNETELKLYADGLIVAYLPDYSSVCIGQDAWTDMCATKSGSDFYHPGLWNASKGSGWAYGNWGFIRQVNYMLENMHRAESNVSTETYKHYQGVAYFWRAYAHFLKMKSFGNIPWIDHVATEDDSLLTAGRADREYVFHMILQDFDKACEDCSSSSKYVTSSRVYINKWVALAYKSRACLWEASYRKYHSVNPSTNQPWNNKYETSDELYRESIKASEELMNSGAFKLHTGIDSVAYSQLFLSENIPTDEVIWSRQSNTAASVTHDMTWNYNSATYGQKYSPTKELVDCYLNLDGTPIANDQFPTYAAEFVNRDWRLMQTVLAPGHTYVNLSGNTVLRAPDFSCVLTGYGYVKWNVENVVNYSQSLSNNSVPILRYGEVLLNYAEAKAELGEMTEAVWNKTIGALRERAGVKSIYPGSAEYKTDPILTAYYNDGVNPDLSNIILEIRRERTVELAMENGNRYWDLIKWNLGRFIAKRYNNQGWRGIYLTAAQVKSGFSINGTDFKIGSSTNATSYKVANSGSNATWSLTNKTYGYLVYNYKLEWLDRMNVDPIPLTSLALSPDLGQNYGWETE